MRDAESAQVGPFYRSADHGVYLDTRFFDALGRRVGVAVGDFARAYVVAHEVGHHVQNLLGISRRIAAAAQQDPAGQERTLGPGRAAGPLPCGHLEAHRLPPRGGDRQ